MLLPDTTPKTTSKARKVTLGVVGVVVLAGLGLGAGAATTPDQAPAPVQVADVADAKTDARMAAAQARTDAYAAEIEAAKVEAAQDKADAEVAAKAAAAQAIIDANRAEVVAAAAEKAAAEKAAADKAATATATAHTTAEQEFALAYGWLSVSAADQATICTSLIVFGPDRIAAEHAIATANAGLAPYDPAVVIKFFTGACA